MGAAQRHLEKNISVVQDLLQVDPIGWWWPCAMHLLVLALRGSDRGDLAVRGTSRMQGVTTLERWAPARSSATSEFKASRFGFEDEGWQRLAWV